MITALELLDPREHVLDDHDRTHVASHCRAYDRAVSFGNRGGLQLRGLLLRHTRP
jgi:hypothetical protein